MSELNKSQSPIRRRSRSRSKGRSDNRPIRVYCPGTYDFLHFGQANFLRKVKEEMCLRFPHVQLVAGIFSDAELIAKDRRPVFSARERFDMLRANKWVDEIVKDVPLQLTKDALKNLYCDYAFCFGQDEPLLEENEEKKDLLECGLFKTVASTKDDYSNISTIDLINRILLLEPRDSNNNTTSGRNWDPKRLTFPDSISCNEMLRFVTGNSPKRTDKIVYVDGSFDVLHKGHLNLLEQARDLGDFLYVGLHSDGIIRTYAGPRFPVMHWNERLMALLACKYVSEIIIDAPLVVSEALVEAFSVDYVVAGIDDYGSGESEQSSAAEIKDRYAAAKKLGVFRELQSDKEDNARSGILTTVNVLQRIHREWEQYRCSNDNGLLLASAVSPDNNNDTDVDGTKVT